MPVDVPNFSYTINGHAYTDELYEADPAAFLIRLAQDVVAVIGAVVGPALATALVAGVVRWDDVTITGDEDAILSAVVATAAAPGIVQPDDATIKITGDTISARTATDALLGVSRPDNATLSVAAGVLSAILATNITPGIVQPDNDTIGVIAGEIFARAATIGTPGIVEPDNVTLNFDGGGLLAAIVATALQAGIVKPDGATISVDGVGLIAARTATAALLGVVQPDDATIKINGSGVLSARTATTALLGVSRPDTTTLTVDGAGILSAIVATAIANGISRPDGTTLEIDAGVLSAIMATASALGIVKPDDDTFTTNIDSAGRLRASPGSLTRAGIATPLRSTLRVPVTSGLLFNTLEAQTDSDGNVLALLDSAGVRTDFYPFAAGRRYPAPLSTLTPAFGGIDESGQFVGFTTDRQVEARIERAYSIMGRAPKMPQAPDVWRIVTDRDGNATIGEAYGGAPISYVSRPTVATEWLASNGDVVAPFTASSRECVVAYVPGTGRVVLTPYSTYHFLNPVLAYGDKCVIAWRYADGDNRSTAQAFAIAIDGTGDMVPEDPNGLFVFLANGQSLSVGSHGEDEYPWLVNSWPDHTLVLENTTNSGDARLGRDADDTAFALDPETIGGFTAMLPQGGNPANLGFTPIEGLVFALQDKIVRKFGRPQRMCVAALGVSGATIDQLSTGTATRTNLEAAIDEIVTSAAAEGWTPYFDAYLWIQGESDATDTASSYQTAFETEVSEVRALCLAAAGTEPKVIVWSWSSFGEAADNETTSLGGNLGQMQAYIADPDAIKMVGPHYPLQAYYNPDISGSPDFVHFLAGGYLRLGEMAAYAVLREAWGLGGAEPLYVLSAVYDDNGGAGPVTVTITWSRTIQQDVTLVPVRDYDGLEVAYASATFKAIISHAITPGSATSVLTLESALTAPQLATATLQVGLKGQASPRDADNVPGTNIRASTGAYDRSEYDGAPYYHFAVHQRLALT